MLNQLPPRERQIVDLLYQRGALAVNDICDALPDRLSGSAVRAMLKRLEDKGFVAREASERGFLFSPTVPDDKASETALGHVVRVHASMHAVAWARAMRDDQRAAGRERHHARDDQAHAPPAG